MVSIEQKPEYFEFINRILGVEFLPDRSVVIASLSDDGVLLGVVVFDRFTQYGCELSVASVSPRFLTRKFLHVLFYYAFVTAGKRRITAVVEDGNMIALDMDKRLGFVQECKMRGWFGDADGYLLRMLKEECRFLEPKL